MFYVISIIRNRFFKNIRRTTITFFVIRGVIDLALWIFIKPLYPINQIWAYIWLGLFLLVLLAEIVVVMDNIQGVKKYFRKVLGTDINYKRKRAMEKSSNSTEKDLLFVIADGLHQGHSLRKINEFLKEKSDNFYSVALKKMKNSDDYKLILFKHYSNGKVESTQIRFTKDADELRDIAEKKINSHLDKYLKGDYIPGRKLLNSVLYALVWESLSDVNHNLRHHLWLSHPDRAIEVKLFSKTEDLYESMELQLFDGGKVVATLEIFREDHEVFQEDDEL